MLDKLIQSVERLVVILIVLSLLPCLIGAVIRAVDTFNLLLLFGILVVVAYLKRGGGTGRAPRVRGSAGGERTPLLPHEDD
jgi:hypothetical protein